MADLTTLADVKSYAGVSGTTADALLAKLITAASAMVETWLSRTINSTTYARVFDGLGSDRLKVPNYPIISVTSLTINGQVIPASSGYGGTGYEFNEDTVYLRGYYFTRGMRNVSITFQAGYAVVPADIAQAVNEMVARRYKERDWLGYDSKSLAGETVSFSTSAMSDSIKTALSAYKRVAIT